MSDDLPANDPRPTTTSRQYVVGDVASMEYNNNRYTT